MKRPLFILVLCSLMFFGFGCSKPATDCPSEPYLGTDPVITNFLETPQIPLSISRIENPKGKLFASYEVFGESRTATTTIIYIWAVITEYSPDPKPDFPQIGRRYTPNGKRGKLFSESLPVAIQISKEGGTKSVSGYQIPRDADLYGKDIVRIFPWCVRAKMYPVTSFDIWLDSYDPQPLPKDSVRLMNDIVLMLDKKNDDAAEAWQEF